MKRLLLLVLVLAAVPAVPARAATVALDGTTLRFTAARGESNHLIFHHRAEDELVVYDTSFPGQPITAAAGCTQDGENTVICPRAGITRAEFKLGGSPRRLPFSDTLVLTAEVPVPVSVAGTSTSGARVAYLDLRPLSVTLDGLANDGPAGRGDSIGPGVDGVFGGDGADTIAGNHRDNVLDGDNGSDGITAGAGDDVVTLATYNDVGADAVGLESRGADSVGCGSGRDMVFYDNSDSVLADCELQVLVFDEGFLYEGTSGADRIIVDQGPSRVDGGAGNDRLGATLLAGDITLNGESGHDRLAGNASNDTLDGGSGRDMIFGAEGDDTIRAADGSTDTVSCGPDRDRVIADRRDRVRRDCERVSRR